MEPYIQYEIEQFLVHEADLLDQANYSAWLELLDETFLYRVPVPRPQEDPTLDRYDPVLEFANESKSFLAMRFSRVTMDHAWAERPAAFVRHFVTNFRVQADESVSDDEWVVRTNVLVVRARRPEPPVMVTAERIDRIRRSPDGLRLVERLVHLDAEIPTDGQLSVIF